MKILILGSGVYVTGKGNAKTGTILGSIIQASIDFDISQIDIISRSKSSETHTHDATKHTNQLLNTSVNVVFYATEDKPENWLEERLNAEHYDMAIVCLPDHLHYKYAKLCFNANIHSLIVKPLTPTYNEGQELLDLANKKKVYGAVEFHKRWDESNLYLKGRIKSGDLGELLYFDVNYSQRVTVPVQDFKAWAAKTNIFQYLGVHYVDLIYFMTGLRPKSLWVYGTKKKLVSLGIDTWDSVHVSSIWGLSENKSKDFYAHFNLNWIDPENTTAMSDQRISVVATEGRIDCDQKNRGIYEVVNGNGAQSINPYFSSWMDGNERPFQLNGYGYKSIRTFIEDVSKLKNNETSINQLNLSRPSLQESLISTQFIEAVSNQLSTGSTQMINL